MGKVLSLMTRPIKRFNIDNRAHNVISKDKPARAPLPTRAEQQLQLAKKLNPTFMDEEGKKNINLDEHLKKIYVTSTDPEIPIKEITFDPTRPLPQRNNYDFDFEYGYMEPSVVLKGKCTLRQAIEFLTKRNADPKNYTSDIIAQEYGLDKKVVDDILEHFYIHKVAFPPNWKPKQLTDASLLKNF